MHNELSKMTEGQMHSLVQSHITDQMVSLFSSIHKNKVYGEEKTILRRNTAENLLAGNTVAPKPWKFSLEVKQSLLPNAGEGVFVHTSASLIPGTVMALYPGLVHLKEHLRNKQNLFALLPDPHLMLMSRMDQSIVDARTAHLCPPNPYALGHKINHCGKKKPNVMQVSYDFPEDLLQPKNSFPEEMRYLIPNKYAKDPTVWGKMEMHNVAMKSVVFISTGFIEDGDEVVMDYRLDPIKELPQWYRSYNVEDAKLRWEREEEIDKR